MPSNAISASSSSSTEQNVEEEGLKSQSTAAGRVAGKRRTKPKPAALNYYDSMLRRIRNCESQIAEEEVKIKSHCLYNHSTSNSVNVNANANANANANEPIHRLDQFRKQYIEMCTDLIARNPELVHREDLVQSMWMRAIYGHIKELRQNITEVKSILRKEKQKQQANRQQFSRTNTSNTTSNTNTKLETTINLALRQKALLEFCKESAEIYYSHINLYERILTKRRQKNSSSPQQQQQQQQQQLFHDNHNKTYDLYDEEDLDDDLDDDMKVVQDPQQRRLAAVACLCKMHTHLGDIHRYQNDFPKAEKCYEYASRLGPGIGAPFNQLAVMAQSNKESSTGIALYYYCRSEAATHEPFAVISGRNSIRLLEQNRIWLKRQHKQIHNQTIQIQQQLIKLHRQSKSPRHKEHRARFLQQKQQRSPNKEFSNIDIGPKIPKTQVFLAKFLDLQYDVRLLKEHQPEYERKNKRSAKKSGRSNTTNSTDFILSDFTSKLDEASDWLRVLLHESTMGTPLLCKIMAIQVQTASKVCTGGGVIGPKVSKSIQQKNGNNRHNTKPTTRSKIPPIRSSNTVAISARLIGLEMGILIAERIQVLIKVMIDRKKDNANVRGLVALLQLTEYEAGQPEIELEPKSEQVRSMTPAVKTNKLNTSQQTQQSDTDAISATVTVTASTDSQAKNDNDTRRTDSIIDIFRSTQRQFWSCVCRVSNLLLSEDAERYRLDAEDVQSVLPIDYQEMKGFQPYAHFIPLGAPYVTPEEAADILSSPELFTQLSQPSGTRDGEGNNNNTKKKMKGVATPSKGNVFHNRVRLARLLAVMKQVVGTKIKKNPSGMFSEISEIDMTDDEEDAKEEEENESDDDERDDDDDSGAAAAALASVDGDENVEGFETQGGSNSLSVTDKISTIGGRTTDEATILQEVTKKADLIQQNDKITTQTNHKTIAAAIETRKDDTSMTQIGNENTTIPATVHTMNVNYSDIVETTAVSERKAEDTSGPSIDTTTKMTTQPSKSIRKSSSNSKKRQIAASTVMTDTRSTSSTLTAVSTTTTMTAAPSIIQKHSSKSITTERLMSPSRDTDVVLAETTTGCLGGNLEMRIVQKKDVVDGSIETSTFTNKTNIVPPETRTTASYVASTKQTTTNIEESLTRYPPATNPTTAEIVTTARIEESSRSSDTEEAVEISGNERDHMSAASRMKNEFPLPGLKKVATLAAQRTETEQQQRKRKGECQRPRAAILDILPPPPLALMSSYPFKIPLSQSSSPRIVSLLPSSLPTRAAKKSITVPVGSSAIARVLGWMDQDEQYTNNILILQRDKLFENCVLDDEYLDGLYGKQWSQEAKKKQRRCQQGNNLKE